MSDHMNNPVVSSLQVEYVSNFRSEFGSCPRVGPSLSLPPPLCVLTLTWTIADWIGGGGRGERGGENLLKGESENKIMHA